MIDPVIRADLERVRDGSGHRSVTIRREYLRHVLEKDEEGDKAGRVMAGLIRSQADDLYWERKVSRAEREAHGVEVAGLHAQLEEERASAYPFGFLGWWSWPVLIVLAAIGGSAVR